MGLRRRGGGATAPGRRGSALILVLVMTLSLAGLAVSAVLLTSSSSLVQRYYDKAKDYRLYALAAIGRAKSNVQRDTTVAIPGDTAYTALSAATITDASGNTNATIKVNAYAGYTGDTGGTYIPFLSILAQAYDTQGVRSVQRLDLQSEAFSRYALFVDSFPTTTTLVAGLHVRGRSHGNRNWISGGSPGTTYYDTLSVVGTISGTSNYAGTGVAVTSAQRIKWPTSTSLATLPTLASNGSLSFAQVGTTTTSFATAGGTNVSGDMSGSSARSGTALRFRPVDVNANGTIDASEGFFMLFDLATGMDTANLRVDPVASTNYASRPTNCPTASGRCVNMALLHQCGLLATISGRKEFFPVTRFREQWVRQRVRAATAPAITDADTLAMSGVAGVSPNTPDTTAIKKILGYGTGYSRCFPAGSPYLMLSERYVDATCTLDSNVASTTLYGWGAAAAGGGARVQYGGQDTTFTVNVRRCMQNGTDGSCYNSGAGSVMVRLGSWRAFGGTLTASPPATVLQAVQTPYLWPISTTYNTASRGVIYASGTTPLFVSDTVRGFVTLYAHGRIVLIDDLVYDQDPTTPDALCRNFLGVIADTNIKVANNAINFPRRDPGGATNYRLLGTPNYTLHGLLLALSTSTTTSRHGTIAVEDSSISATLSPVLTCNGTNTSGGCLNHVGGEVMRTFHQVNGAAGTGLVRNLTRDPCQEQATNRRPPFFPLTGKYVDYKWYDVDPRNASTWSAIKTYLAALRGKNRAVP
jgi:hypothetical protein